MGIILILRESTYTPIPGGSNQGTTGGNQGGTGGGGSNTPTPGGNDNATNLLSTLAPRTENTKFSDVGGPTVGNGAVMIGMVAVNDYFASRSVTVTPAEGGKYIVAGYDTDRKFKRWLTNGGVFNWVTYATTCTIDADIAYIRICLNTDQGWNDSTGHPYTDYAESITA